MPGILSAVNGVIGVVETVQQLTDDKISGTEKARKILEKVSDGTLVSCTGDITKLINKFILTPTIIVSNSLKDSEVIYDVVQLQTDIFAAYYTQAFKILVDLKGVSPENAMHLLSTMNITPMQAAGAAGLNFMSSSVFNKMISKESLDDYSLKILSTEKMPIGQSRAQQGNGPASNDDPERAKILKARKDYMEDEDFKKYKQDIVKHGKDLEFNRYDAVVGTRGAAVQASFLKGHEPDTYAVYERQFELTITTEQPFGDKVGIKKQVVVLPMTIKANVIFTPYANIENVISPRKDDKTFWYRMNEWRAGSISFWELVTASDLIKKYKENRLRDKENILSMLNSANARSFLKGVANKDLHEGYEQFYNMVIISANEKEQLERYIGGKLSADRYKDKFLNAASSMTITVIDEDYEKVTIQTKDIAGTSIVPFKKLKRRKGDKDDLTEIFKAMLASRSPVFA